MMLRKSLFALSAVLLLGTTAACGDKDEDDPGNGNNNGEVSCDDDPTQEKCLDFENARDTLAYSYVNGLVLPEADAEADACCWDYVADNNDEPLDYDNALGSLLSGLVGEMLDDIDLDEVLGELFEEGTLTLLLEYKNLVKELDTQNGGVQIALHLGESESDWSDRNSGDGVFTLGDKLADITGNVRRSSVDARADNFPLSLDLTGFVDEQELVDLGLPKTLTISLSKVRLALDISEDSPDKISNDVAVTSRGGKSTNFLTGLISSNELISVLNEVVGKGMCDLEGDALELDDSPSGDDLEEGDLDKPEIYVNPEYEDDLADCLGDLISGIDIVPMIGLVGEFFDVDSDGDGVADGLSLGLFLSIAGAEIQ